jgi:hypothetical protein
MREIRPSGSEGGDGSSRSLPYQRKPTPNPTVDKAVDCLSSDRLSQWVLDSADLIRSRFLKILRQLSILWRPIIQVVGIPRRHFFLFWGMIHESG